MSEKIPVVVEVAKPYPFTLQDGKSELSGISLGDMVGQTTDAVFVLDDRQCITYLNAAAQRQYGVSETEALGHPLTDVFRYSWRHPGDEAAMRSVLAEVGYWRGENVHIKRNGENLHVECSVSRLPLKEGVRARVLVVARDMNERWSQAEISRRNELRLRLALDAAYMISFEWDIQRNEVRRFQSTLPGLPITPDEQPGTFEDVCQVVHPEDREHFTTNIYAAMQREEGHYESEFRIVQPDGTVNWLYEYGRVERDAEGKPAYLIGLSVDITERKRNEALLLQSQRRYAGIVESAMDAIVTVDSRQRILLFNAAAEKMFKCTADKAIGSTLERFIPKRFHRLHDEHLRKFRQEGDTNRKMGSGGSVTGLRTDGEEFPVEASISRVTVNGEVSFTAILRDISERKRTEDKLREREEQLQLFIEHAPVSIAMFDRDMCYLAASNRWKTDFHLPEDMPLMGQSHYELFPEVPERWKDAHRRGLAGETLRKDEDPFERLDGSLQWLKWEVLPWFSGDNHVGGILIAAEEISERVRTQQALQEANRRKDEFLAMLAHELRNPLAPIHNAVQILRMTGSQNPVLEQTTGMIERQVNHLVRLVDDLLDVSRVSRGKIKLRKEIIDLEDVILQAVETSQPLIEARGHELQVSLPQHTVRLDGDFTRLAQVISNLLNNSAKYTDAGGKLALSVEQQKGSAEVLIRVHDNGHGIDPGILDSLFELFYQADRNLDRAEGGLGIGLSLVKNIIEMHGGQVEARSEGRDKGSEFIIRLPCLTDEPASRFVQVMSEQAKSASGRHILLVDDNPDVIDSMALLLSLYGHEVLQSQNGQEAIEIALREQPDLILLDIGLPGMDGYQVCREMRNAGLNTAMIVALTGYGREEDRGRAADAGFDHYLAKPVDVAVLEELLDSLSAHQGQGSPEGS